MKDATVDDLVGALFPGEKLPPSTTAASQQQSAKFKKSSFDDSEDESSPKKQPPQQQQANTGVVPGPAPVIPPKATSQQHHHHQHQPQPIATKKFTTPAAAWPQLPRSLMRVCDLRSFSLTNHISERDIATHHRVLFQPPGSPADSAAAAAESAIAAERDASLVSDDGAAFCPYIRCLKCDHAVVRLQNAYVVNIGGSDSAAPQQQQGATPKTSSETNKVVEKKEKTAHSWDDDSGDDDENQETPASSGSTAAAAFGNVTPMYMLCRNHYPDFAALERTGAMRRTSIAQSTTALQCALYWCQCTIASCCHKRVRLDGMASATATAAALDVPEAVKKQLPSTELPYSSPKIDWSCVGHHQSYS